MTLEGRISRGSECSGHTILESLKLFELRYHDSWDGSDEGGCDLLDEAALQMFMVKTFSADPAKFTK